MRRAIPDGRKRVAYRKMVTGLVFLGLFVVLNPSYNYSTALTPWFAEQSLLHRYVSAALVWFSASNLAQTYQDCLLPVVWARRA